MNLQYTLSNKLRWTFNSIQFFKTHFVIIGSFALVAALGRVIQLGGFGEITPAYNVALEIVVEAARGLIFLFVLGLGNTKDGFFRILHLFKKTQNRKLIREIALQKVRKQWASILLNTMVFSLIAAAINYLIELLAYETCLYITLKSEGILGASSSEWTILLFFKNISIIPFTLVFDAVFLLWITNKFRTSANAGVE